MTELPENCAEHRGRVWHLAMLRYKMLMAATEAIGKPWKERFQWLEIHGGSGILPLAFPQSGSAAAPGL
jgi:hypothetical protein